MGQKKEEAKTQALGNKPIFKGKTPPKGPSSLQNQQNRAKKATKCPEVRPKCQRSTR